MTWETPSTVTPSEAIERCTQLATEQGIKGAFKIFYKDGIVVTIEDLPSAVDMDFIRISAVLDQA